MAIPLIAFRVENCHLVTMNPQLAAVAYGVTKGNPCTTRCNHFKGGSCASYQRLRQVPIDFDSQVMSLCRSNMGLMALAMHLSSLGSNSPGLPIALHLLTAKDPLQLQDPSDIWDKLKELYPAKEGGIDCDKLMVDINKKLAELGL